MNMAESYLNGQKTLCEKEKLLVTSNFSFSHSVFKRLDLQTRENQGLFGKGLKGNTWSSGATRLQTKGVTISKNKTGSRFVYPQWEQKIPVDKILN